MAARFKTSYPGVFYREAKRIGRKGTEKVYYVVFKKNGKTIEEKAGRQYSDAMTPARASSYRSARIEGKKPSRKELREIEEERKAREQGKWTIKRLYEEYEKTRPANKSLSTDKSRYNRYLKKPFGNKEPSELIPLEIDRLRINLLKKRSPQTVKHVLNLLTWIINFGVKKGLCEGIGFHIQKPTVNNIKTEDLSQSQLEKLLLAIEEDKDIQTGNLMRLALYTGMRKGELFNLRWEDIDFERGFLNIRDPKGGRDQIIPLNEGARGVLKHHPREKSLYVFPGRFGSKRATVTVSANRIKEAAGLPEDFRPIHGLRHVYASMLASSGKVDMYTLQRLLTHKDPRMTQRYVHLRDAALKGASDLASDIIKKADEGKNKQDQSKTGGLEHEISG